MVFSITCVIRPWLLIVLFKRMISLLICLLALVVTKSSILEPPIMVVKLSIYLFNSDNFCFIYLETMVLDGNKFRLVYFPDKPNLSSLWSVPLSLTTNTFSHKAYLHINIHTSTFFWLIFTQYLFHPFTFNLSMCLYIRYVSCKQHALIVFKIHINSHPNFYVGGCFTLLILHICKLHKMFLFYIANVCVILPKIVAFSVYFLYLWASNWDHFLDVWKHQ